MNKITAKRIAEKITNEQLKDMFDRAKKEIKDWHETSLVNIGLSKGIAWNILAKDFDVNNEYHIMAKVNMIREFGAFLCKELKPSKRRKRVSRPPVHHQDPKFK